MSSLRADQVLRDENSPRSGPIPSLRLSPSYYLNLTRQIAPIESMLASARSPVTTPLIISCALGANPVPNTFCKKQNKTNF